MTALQINKEETLRNLFGHEVEANATYPEGATLGELFAPSGSESHSVPALLLSAWEADIPAMLIGAPGVAKTAIVRYLAEIMNAEFIFFGKNAAPSSAVVPGLGSTEINGEKVEYIDYLIEDALRSNKPKIIMFDELSRMNESMRQQALEVLGPNPRISGFEIKNVIGRVATGNRVEDGIDPLDPALATRMITLPVRASSVPWKYFVAQEFSEVDLTEVYKVHDALDPTVREQITPRKIRKIVWNLLHNGSGWPALAMIDSDYETFNSVTDQDVTSNILDDFANALGTTNRDQLSDPMEAVFTAVVDHGETVYVEGAPGIGKTTAVEAGIRQRRPDASILSVSMANAAPEDWNMVMIKDGELKRQLLKFFAEPGEKYLIADEVWRAPDDVMDMLLEVFQERTIAGKPTGLTGIVALNNPRQIEGYQLDVGVPDAAQADRFTMSVSISAQQTKFRSYILSKYGEIAEHFVNWWEGLSTQEQVLYPPRVLEMAIKWHSLGLPLDQTRPWYDGMPMEISFHSLERALADRPLVMIRDVASRVDHFVEALSVEGGQNTEEHRSVFDAFDRADIVQLREHEEAVLSLLPLLSTQSRLNLVRDAGDKLKFWTGAVIEAANRPTLAGS